MNAIATLEGGPISVPFPCDEERLYEIVDGQRVELPPMSIFSVLIASRLHVRLGEHAAAHNLGQSAAEGLFRLPLPQERNRRPDVAYVAFTRWAADRPIPETEDAWDVVPNIACEVVSPTDKADDLLSKVEEYLRAGVQQVWVLYPRHRVVYIYEAFTVLRVLSRADTLDGGAVLPGFRLPLAELFPEPTTT